MNTSTMVLGAVVIAAAGAVGGYKVLNPSPEFAEVLSVKPVTKTETIPQEVCHEETVVKQKPVKDEHRVAGTAIGAVVGGLIGSQIGGGDGKKVATVAGAVAGGYAGNKAQESMQQNDTYTAQETRCETIYEERSQLLGYEVKYQLGEETGTVRMDHKPGKTIPVQDGALVLTKAPEAASK